MGGVPGSATRCALWRLAVCTLLAGCGYQPLQNTPGENSDIPPSADLAPAADADMAWSASDLARLTDLAPSDLSPPDLAASDLSQSDPSHADLATPRDLSGPQDLSQPRDLSLLGDLSGPRDLSLRADLSEPRDLSLPPDDLSGAYDCSVPADLTTQTDLASPPDTSACMSFYRNWLMYDQSLAATSPCGLDSLQCGWAAFPACSAVSLATTTQPAAGQIDWSLNEVGILGDFIGAIDDNGHFDTINEYFSGSTFVGDIDANCNATGTIDWVPDQLCISVRQISAVPQ